MVFSVGRFLLASEAGEVVLHLRVSPKGQVDPLKESLGA